jgi:DNA-binding response OmpR family regulator
MRAANVVLDPVSCTVMMDEQKIDIGHAEYKLLKFLLAHPGACSRAASCSTRCGATTW